MIVSEKDAESIQKWADCEKVDDSSDLQRKLIYVFVEHSFFRSRRGVFIVEQKADRSRQGRRLVKRVHVAAWSDESRTILKPLESTERARQIHV